MTKANDCDNEEPGLGQSGDGVSRREFMRASAAVAGATLLASHVAAGESAGAAKAGRAAGDYLAHIEHVVVVMLENRSFDNLLGYLYRDKGPTSWPLWMAANFQPTTPPAVPKLPGQAKAQAFEGLWKFLPPQPPTAASCLPAQACNLVMPGNLPCPAHFHDFDPAKGTAADWTHPNPNSGEGFANTRRQLASSKATGKPTMGGFATNYYDVLVKDNPGPQQPSAYQAMMGSYTPDHLPVLSTLARNFAVYDHWFSAVPSETYCNRAFFHASTSYGYTENGSSRDNVTVLADSWRKWQSPPLLQANKTIFDALEKASVSWGVYFSPPNCPAAGEQQFFNVVSQVGLTGLVHYAVGQNYGPPAYAPPVHSKLKQQRFWPFANFFDDVKAGALPKYTFIEPLYGTMPFPLPGGSGSDFHPPGDVRNGEEVVRQIYEAIRTSGTTGKRDYTKDTLLLIVFDEHGGTYDHVVPGAAPAPGLNYPNPEYKFDFTALGPRVPAIAISAYTQPGTVLNEPMHHAAVINTLFRKFIYPTVKAGDPKPYLTNRDKGMNGGDLGLAHNIGKAVPRPAAQWPALPAPTFKLTPVIGPCPSPGR